MDNDSAKKFNFFLKGTNSKAVLLIHGITGTPSEMHYLGKGLNKAGFSVLCNTLPRHCLSLGELKKATWQEIYAACAKDLQELRKEHEKVFVGGLSMGALISMHLAFNYPGDVAGILALAPTLFYDGWALHKGKVLMELLWHIPLFRDSVNIREGWPYGLKDEYLRNSIERFYKNAKAQEFDNKVLLFGSPFFPLASLYQHHLFVKVVKKELAQIKTPILIMHAKEDDMTSLKNAQYCYQKIAATNKALIVLEDSYHMITIDKEKKKVIEESLNFLNSI
jgi:carboxylesterase